MSKKRIVLGIVLVSQILIALFFFVLTILQNIAVFAVLSLLAAQFGTWALVEIW